MTCTHTRLLDPSLETAGVAFHTHKACRLGTESRLVTMKTLLMIIIVINIFPLRIVLAYKHFFHLHKCLRPYHREYTSSRLITEIKPGRAGLVLGWVTAW